MTRSERSQTSGTTLLVLAKAPVPGRVKTRLTPPYTPQEAARIAEASLADTLDAVLATPVHRRVLVLDGEPGPWLPPGIEVMPQCAGGLDERIAAAFAACSGPTLLIGMDTPQITPARLAPALEGPQPDEAWFGPAEDGGFWALGLTDPDPALLLGVPMSVAETGRVQRQRLLDAGLFVRELARLRDVDTARDAQLVAAQAPHGRFARALRTRTRTQERMRTLTPVTTADVTSGASVMGVTGVASMTGVADMTGVTSVASVAGVNNVADVASMTGVANALPSDATPASLATAPATAATTTTTASRIVGSPAAEPVPARHRPTDFSPPTPPKPPTSPAPPTTPPPGGPASAETVTAGDRAW